ncbi:hypothetical protein FNH13_09630 [Ornithinimicrobium ciconiae]|uniref:Calcineurin-like phosphoesterase domain-containing protein n=1 Tax=Ornithinimicrobium ciconiae TaxID=2594265 RepID=A0A516GAL2_9MICO|nr:metallophosphoesterase [Ornithinimicrobium ciconiae]QDO88566.1 hypothetical protein FNH13_09630 [Ornithinimicrobium ciconiae]
MMDRYAFIGDVHGALRPLIAAVEHAQHVAESIVLLGDYVNRGEQSREVLDFLLQAETRLAGRIHFLAGHHDLAFLGALDHGREDAFLRMGGAATLSSYPYFGANGTRLDLRERVPPPHVKFLRCLESSFVTDECVAFHDQADAPPLKIGQFGVFGHRPILGNRPYIAKDFALIDTGCGTLPDGRLTCFQWPSRDWIQTG